MAVSCSAGCSSSATGSALPLSRTGCSDGLRLLSAANLLGLRPGSGTSLLLLGAARLPDAALSWAADSRLASLGAGGTTAAAGAAAVPSLGGVIGWSVGASAAGSITAGRFSGRGGVPRRAEAQVVLPVGGQGY